MLVLARAPVGVGGDAGYYHSAANLIAHGHFLDRRIFGHTYPTAEHPPLFPLVLSVVSLFGGESLLAHRITGCVIGVAAVLAIAVLATRARGPRAGLIAGGLAAVYPPLVTADGLVMSEPLFVLLVTVTVFAALGLHRRPSTARAVGLGALVGLTALARGEGLLLLPLLGWPVAWRAVGGLRGAAACTLATVAVLAPWLVFNAVRFGRPVLATDSNTLIAGANCPDTYFGHDLGWWSNDCLSHHRTRVQLDRGDASTGAAFTFAADHPARLPLVAAVRVLRTFDMFQPLRQGNRELRRKWIDVAGFVMYLVVLGLALVGLRDPTGRWELLAPVAMVVIVSVLGWGIGRFRVGADVSLLVLAAGTLAYGSGSPAARRWRTISSRSASRFARRSSASR